MDISNTYQVRTCSQYKNYYLVYVLAKRYRAKVFYTVIPVQYIS